MLGNLINRHDFAELLRLPSAAKSWRIACRWGARIASSRSGRIVQRLLRAGPILIL